MKSAASLEPRLRRQWPSTPFVPDPAGHHPGPDTESLSLAELRQRKRRLANLVQDRLARGGAVPIDRDWWTEDWERHTWEPFADGPWDPFAYGASDGGARSAADGP